MSSGRLWWLGRVFLLDIYTVAVLGLERRVEVEASSFEVRLGADADFFPTSSRVKPQYFQLLGLLPGVTLLSPLYVIVLRPDQYLQSALLGLEWILLQA